MWTCSRRPEQVQGLTSDILTRMVVARPETAMGRRDAALIAVGYDTLCRSVELAALQVEHLEFGKNVGCLLIPRSKGDVAGDGRIAYLSERTQNLLEDWLIVSGIKTGPLFRGFCGGAIRENALDTSTIRRLIKRAARRADLPDTIWGSLSGHSMRVGAAQDMLSAGFDSLAIMQSGGWKTLHIVLRYVENASTQALHQERWNRLQY